MLYLPITKGWIVSPLARRIYFACALLALALFGTIFASLAALAASSSSSLAESPAAALVVRFLLLPEVLGTALLSIAMWYFWLSFDQSSWIKKTLWFFPLYLLLGAGPSLYYFFVYLPSFSVASGHSSAPN
jgi:hypothetical protein